MKSSYPSVALVLLLMVSNVHSQEDKATELQFEKWSKDLNVPDPVAISFDSNGRAYVTQTTRRKANDLDIRNNRDWTVNDVSFESVKDKIDFYRIRLAPKLSTKNKRRVKDLNGDGSHDFRDLMQLSEKIHIVQDTDNDGFADSIKVFAEDFKTEVTGIAAGVMHWKGADNSGSVYATIAPDVWKLEDTNGDQVADRRTKIATGFGLHIAYAGHDMHGLTRGPDGKVYWSIGDKGISVTSKEGRRFHFPNQGGVMRCNPDGTEFEVFAHGLRNVQELAFDQFGNLFGVDNDADQPGERERFVYIVRGMDAGWRCHYQYRGNKFNPWTDEKLWQKLNSGQPAYIIPPIEYSINGPCGFAYNPGTALSRRYHDYFFLTGAPHGEQIAFRAIPNGASFRMADVHQIGKGIALIGINFGPDGALYGVDWANGYPLNQKGAIWRIDAPDGRSAQKNPLRLSTKNFLAKRDMQKETARSLQNILQHPDQRVRLRAQFELVRRKDHKSLHQVAIDPKRKQLARVHAIWGIGQLNEILGTDWGKLVNDKDLEIRAQTLKIISNLKVFDSAFLQSNLDTVSPRVRFFLLQALASHGDSNWIASLIKMAKKIERQDVYQRHALAMALAACEVDKSIDVIIKSQNETLRLATVVALRQLKSEIVVRFLDDKSTLVRVEAARAIHDDFSISSAMPRLAERANRENESERFLRRALNANLRLGKNENLNRLLEFVADQRSPESQIPKLQIEVLNWIANWESPNPLDEVTGRFREYQPRRLSVDAKKDIERRLTELLAKKSGPIQTAIVKTLGKLKIRLGETGLVDIIKNPKSTEPLAVESLKQLAKQESSLLANAIRVALNSNKPQLRLAGIEQLANTNPSAALIESKKSFGKFEQNAANQKLVRILSQIKIPESTEFLNKQFANYIGAGSSRAFSLELFEAVEQASNENKSARELLKQFKESTQSNASNKLLGEFRLSLYGGNAKLGKKIFETHADAQCTRCHRIGKSGSSVGPALDKIGRLRKPEHLLTSIVQPDAEIEKNYRSVLIALYSGKTLTGVKISEDKDSITIADAMGKKIKVLRDDIEQIGSQKKSLMPDMKKTLTKQQIRDLVAFLKSLK